jgi:beta-aspartyl-peptidase (threonine type)
LKRTIIVHGGGWNIPKGIERLSLKGVEKAARVGFNCLLKGGSAVDAVESAVKEMEDNPVFDAGTGSVLNSEGRVELDAAIMDGKSLDAGAVGAVRDIRNPISLARRIMDNTDHIFLVGEGANKFAESQNFQKFNGLVVKKELERWKRLHSEYRRTMRFSGVTDTVGAVALDSESNIAAGTSTGGVPFKLPGRIGDSCLIGCGLYADNQTGGVSATGHGESIMRIALSRVVCEFLGRGLDAQKAAEQSIKTLEKRIKGRAGVIVLDKNGGIGIFYNTPKMVRAYMREGMSCPTKSI